MLVSMKDRLQSAQNKRLTDEAPSGGRPNNKIVDSIHKAYETFSNQEKKVADFVLEAPGELSVYPASELARLCGVSNATITRFVRRMGFNSYDEVRLAAREARRWGSPLYQPAGNFSRAERDGDHFLAAFVETEVNNLTQALAGLSHDEIDEISTELVKARNLAFMGFRNSYFLASYARTQFMHFRDRTRIVPGAGETVTERTCDLGPGDVVVVVGLRRIVGTLRRHIVALSERDAKILLITDPSARIVPAYARWTITCPVETPHIFDSYSGVQAILRLLAYTCFKKSGKQGREYMEKMETLHEMLGEFE